MSDEGDRKLCLARHLYKNSLISEPVPSSKDKKRSSKSFKTWRDWWKEKHNDDILDYIEEMKKRRQNEK